MRDATLVFVLAALGTLGVAQPAFSQALDATLTLDGLSFVSFDQDGVHAIPAGSSIVFRFGSPDAKGSAGFEIRPEDLRLAPIPLGKNRELSFALRKPASGTMAVTDDGRAVMTFDAPLRVGLEDPTNRGSRALTMHFTTDAVQARNAAGTRAVAVEGMRIDPGARAVQLVGATTGVADDAPGSDEAIHVVLSGTFDALPQARGGR